MSEQRLETCPCALFARATERAALAGARWLGRADQESAEEAARGRCPPTSVLPIDGRVVSGPDEGRQLGVGERVGAGGEAVDLAVDPLEGRGVVARGGNGAMSMIAVGEPGRCSGAGHVHAQDGGRARSRGAGST